MTVPSALVVGGGVAGCVIALALSQRGLDVAIVGHRSTPAGDDLVLDPAAQEALDRIGALPPEPTPAAVRRIPRTELHRVLVDLMQRQAVDIRFETQLLGSFDLGTHTEAEFSDGCVENFDLVIEPDADALRMDEALMLADRIDTGDPRA